MRSRRELVADRDRAVTDDEVVTGSRRDVYAEERDVVDRSRRWYEFDLVSRVNALVFATLAGIETLLALRFAFRAFGANPNSGFVDFIYDLSWPFVRPFDSAFRSRTWDQGIVEVNTVLAMAIYALIFTAIAMLLSAVLPRITRYHDEEGVRYVRSGGVTRTHGH